MNKRNGDKIPKDAHSSANASFDFVIFFHTCISLIRFQINTNVDYSLQHVIVTVIQTFVFTTKRSIDKDYLWIFMVTTKVVVFVKNVNTIPKASTVINVNRNTIDHMEKPGMKLMCADVSFLIILLFLPSLQTLCGD